MKIIVTHFTLIDLQYVYPLVLFMSITHIHKLIEIIFLGYEVAEKKAIVNEALKSLHH